MSAGASAAQLGQRDGSPCAASMAYAFPQTVQVGMSNYFTGESKYFALIGDLPFYPKIHIGATSRNQICA